MNFVKRDKSIVDFVFILALFAVFIVATLFVVLFGSEIYKKTVSDMEKNFSSRTALAYITEKMHSHDYTGGVDVLDFEDILANGQSGDSSQKVLALYTSAASGEYVTYLYKENDYLKEYTGLREKNFDSSKGMDILPIKEFEVSKESDSLYSFHIIDGDNNAVDFCVSIYSSNDVCDMTGEEAGNE